MKQILFLQKSLKLQSSAEEYKAIMESSTSSYAKSNVESKIASTKAVADDSNILSIIDKSMKHLNQISEANFIAQDLYIELLKEKKTMKFEQIKKIYFTLTQSKAKEVLFEREKKQLMETDYQNHEGLIRLCWRSIEKLIKKITYYMINENNLSVISKNVLKLIQLNQSFVRRFQKLKNSSMLFIVEIIEKLIEENSILEKNIYDILLNRGYVVSLDEFYKLNGYDAEHREAYYAKKEQEIVETQSQESEPEKQVQSQKQSGKNSRNQTIRKKKGFRNDPRYSWKQKILMQQKKQKQKNPNNKTNFEIRQSFEKLIGDFLENQNLNEILDNYKFQQDKNIEKKEKPTPRQNQINHMQKKIFQNKIGSVISTLKRNSVVKASSKLLEIINISSQQAIKSKVGYIEKRFVQRKNSNGGDNSMAQRKMRESMMNDRKIVNENYFRELRKRNANMQNFMNQEIILDTKRIQMELQNLAFEGPKPNSKVIEFTKKRHNQNNSTGVKKSKFAHERTNDMFALNFKNSISKEQTPRQKSRKPTFKFFQTEFNWKDAMGTRKNISDSKNGISVAQKIKIAKYEWQLKNEKHILEAIQKSSIDPSNVTKLTQILQQLNQKKDLTMTPLCQTLKEIGNQSLKPQSFLSKKELKFQTIQTEAGTEACIQNMAFKESNKRDFSKFNEGLYSMKRVKTEQSPTRGEMSKRSKNLIFQSWKENRRPYEIYDRRLKRILRRQ